PTLFRSRVNEKSRNNVVRIVIGRSFRCDLHDPTRGKEIMQVPNSGLVANFIPEAKCLARSGDLCPLMLKSTNPQPPSNSISGLQAIFRYSSAFQYVGID